MKNLQPYLSISLIYWFLASSLIAQNLVPNGSFEETIRCPVMHDSTALKYWFVPTKGTADFWNTCKRAGNPSKPLPHPISGFQTAKSGNGIAGMATHNIILPDVREYIGVKLKNALEKDTTYVISFQVNLHDSSRNTTKIGIAFSTIRQVHRNLDPMYLTPVLETSSSVGHIDTASWTQVDGLYKAKGGEQYLYIGNFHPDKKSGVTFYQHVKNWFDTGTYYFVDDVLVANYSDSDFVGVREQFNQSSKQLIRVVDMMGQDTQIKPGTLQIYIYDDGSTEKVIRWE